MHIRRPQKYTKDVHGWTEAEESLCEYELEWLFNDVVNELEVELTRK